MIQDADKEILPKDISAHLHQAFAFRQESDYHAIEPVSLQETDEIIHGFFFLLGKQ
jgi:hypothetical protein